MHDHACTEKSDACEQSLNDAARRIRQPACLKRLRIGKQDNGCGREAHEPQRANADRLAVQIPIEANSTLRQRREAEPQNDVPPVEQCDRLSDPAR